MSNGFHCQGCAETRIRDLRKDIQEIRSLVDHFNRTPALVILAQWGTPGDFRFNSTFCLKSVTQEYLSDQGVFPGAVGKVYPDIAMALKPIGVSQAEIEGLIQQMSALHIVALVRTVEGIRAIRTGVTRSEAGVLFLQPKVPRPRPREEDNGIRINCFVQLTDDVYYFET